MLVGLWKYGVGGAVVKMFKFGQLVETFIFHQHQFLTLGTGWWYWWGCGSSCPPPPGSAGPGVLAGVHPHPAKRRKILLEII